MNSCASTPCTPKTLAEIESAYIARLMVECKGYTFETCPAVPALKANRAAEETKASCR